MIIYVDSEEEKQKLLDESKYIHDFLEIVEMANNKEKWIGLDSDKAGLLMHI